MSSVTICKLKVSSYEGFHSIHRPWAFSTRSWCLRYEIASPKSRVNKNAAPSCCFFSCRGTVPDSALFAPHALRGQHNLFKFIQNRTWSIAVFWCVQSGRVDTSWPVFHFPVGCVINRKNAKSVRTSDILCVCLLCGISSSFQGPPDEVGCSGKWTRDGAQVPWRSSYFY
jgi:hypothetical protein